jgi:hypothetical protein
MNLTVELSTDQHGTTSHIIKHGEDTQPECYNIHQVTLSYCLTISNFPNTRRQYKTSYNVRLHMLLLIYKST